MIWLASRSPRRRQLLEWCGFIVQAHPTAFDETREPGEHPVSHARRLARGKAMLAPPGQFVVAADTVVHRDGQIFDMPRDRQDARNTLLGLSGGWHLVTTGVAVRGPASEATVLQVTTKVRFRTLSPAEIDAYVATGEADDKAGAYGVQGRGGALVAALDGSWTNVMGLPVEETLAALADLGCRP